MRILKIFFSLSSLVTVLFCVGFTSHAAAAMIQTESVTLNGTNGLVNVVETTYQDTCCDTVGIGYNGVGYELLINGVIDVSAFGVTNNGVGWYPGTDVDGWLSMYLSRQEWDSGIQFNYEGVNTLTSDLGIFATLFGTEDGSIAFFHNSDNSSFRRNSASPVPKHDYRLTNGASSYSEFAAFNGGVVISSSLTKVSEPANFVIVAFCLMGLVSRRFKTKTSN
jgi:hypothetical protein